jgi:dUTP pyrophosphatase
MEIAQFFRTAEALFKKKNKQYGRDNVTQLGVIVRLRDKLARLEHLTSSSIDGESAHDACVDIANYAYILDSLLNGSWHDTQDRTCASVTGEVRTPQKPGDAGFDLCYVGEAVLLMPGKVQWLDTGVNVLAPTGTWYSIKGRSSMTRKNVVVLDNVIDQDYTGRLYVACLNVGDTPMQVLPHDRIAQLVFFPLVVPPVNFVEVLPHTERGADGYGSTGT